MTQVTIEHGGEEGGGGGDVRNHTQASPLASQRDPSRGGTTARLPTTLFPLGYKEGFHQWWAAISPAVAEHNVLSFLPFNNIPHPSLSVKHPNQVATENPPTADPHGPRTCASTLVPLSGKDRFINEFSITRTAEEKKEDLVILHGYGAGLGFFYRNFDQLSRRPGWKLYALDLLGYGRSGRPPFKIHATDKEGKIREAENWFIDSLEEWRITRGIDRFTLIGHSLGGYLAVAYALKYPGRLKKLILASPAGIPEDPYAVRESLPTQNAGENPSVANEYLKAQTETIANANNSSPNLTDQTSKITNPQLAVPPNTSGLSSSAPVSPSSSATNLNSNDNSQQSKSNSVQPPRRPYPKWMTYLWDANISPFSIIRWAGPLGPRFVSGWTSRRFGALPPEESQALHNYSYSLFRQRGSGEYALAYILAPGAFARSPIIWRIGKINIPTVLMYGDMDWMDVKGGFAAMDKIRQESARADREGWIGGSSWTGKKRVSEEAKDGEVGGGEAKVVIIKKAGHHLYLDGWEEFNEVMLKEMEDVEERERRRRLWKEKEGTKKED